MFKKNRSLFTVHRTPNINRFFGFTLLELLMVMAIIGTLASVLLVLINPAEISRRTRDSKRISDLGTIRSAIDLALSDGQTLHSTDWKDLGTSTITDFDGGGLNIGKYLSKIPGDPGGTVQYVKLDCSTANGGVKKYEYKSNGNVYLIRVQLESATNCDKLKTDDNNANDVYELGTDSYHVL